MRFAVWAPLAERVELRIDGTDVPATPAGGDWWAAETEAEHGSRYGWRLDGHDPLPDPRSRWQPDGVDGLSAVDRQPFAWTDASWRGFHLPGAVLYELHVGTFTPAGSFDGVVERLPHLVDLGVDAIQLLPVAAFRGARGWGYDGVALSAVHEPYGGPAGLRRLVDAAHGAGIGVLLDVVHNHLGPGGEQLAAFGPYFSDQHRTRWGPALDLDGPGSHEVRDLLVDNALGWLREFHLDGLRLDAVDALVDGSAVHLLEELADAVAAQSAHLRRPGWLIAESEQNDPRYVQPPEAGGFGLHAVWADEWHHALHAHLTGERGGYYVDFGGLDDLVVALRRAWVHTGDHSRDRNRRHGRPPEGLGGERFVVSVQNHDQVGNRAVGDRLGHQVDVGRLRAAAALLLTSPFTPLLFQGEEWNATTPFRYFTDHPDPDVGRAVAAGRHRELAAFGWDPDQVPDPQDPATFEASVLRWEELHSPQHRDLYRWYRALVRLRRARPELTDGRWAAQVVDHDPSGWITVRRGGVLVLVHLGEEPVVVPVPEAARAATVAGCTLLAGAELADGAVHLAPGGAGVLLLDHPAH